MKKNFEKIETGYRGSYFGITGSNQQLIAYGLRGSIWQSLDHGDSWEKLEAGFHVGISDAVMSPEMTVFASAGGRLKARRTDQEGFVDLPAPPVPYTSLLLAGEALIATSLGGVVPIPLNAADNHQNQGEE